MKKTFRSFLLPTLLCSAAAVQAQSTCETALPVGPGIHTVPGVTGTAPAVICSGNPTAASHGMWYVFTATVDTGLTVSSSVPGYPNMDTRMHVYTGICGTLACHAGDDDSGPNYSSICTFVVSAGTTYYIAWDNYWNSNGFTFSVTEVEPPVVPEDIVSFTSTAVGGAGQIEGVVDMNNDGLDDLVSPGYTSFIISHQQPGGGFVPTTFPTTPADNTASWSFAIGDWDSNGHRDLLYGGGSGATFMKANADGTAYTEITFPEYIFCQRTNFADLNNDGHLDAFSCHDVNANVAFINDGNGNLTFTQGGYGTTCGNYGSIFTDYNNDGVVDLFVAKCGCDPQDLMMTNNGTGAFTNIAPAQGLADSHQSWSSAWGDFDNDGDMDVFIGASSGGYHKLLFNDGAGNFMNVTAGSGMDAFGGQSIEWTAHDFNNDGWIDILGGGALHYNNGDGTFSHQSGTPANHAVGDLDNDGFLDIATSNGYQRNNGNGKNWIRINPIGVASNRDAIGARVTIVSALGTQIRDIRSGDGFAYMSFIGAHFGLGTDTEVESVTVHWPSGNIDVIENPAINTVHSVVEGTFTSVPLADATDLTLAPNPAADVLVLSGAPMNAPVELVDAAGQLVRSTRAAGGRVDVSGLASGSYVLRISIDGRPVALRFAKQ